MKTWHLKRYLQYLQDLSACNRLQALAILAVFFQMATFNGWLRYSTDVHYINQWLGKVVNARWWAAYPGNIPQGFFILIEICREAQATRPPTNHWLSYVSREIPVGKSLVIRQVFRIIMSKKKNPKTKKKIRSFSLWSLKKTDVPKRKLPIKPHSTPRQKPRQSGLGNEQNPHATTRKRRSWVFFNSLPSLKLTVRPWN